MAVIDVPAPLTRYSDTVLNKRVIGDRVNMIDPMDTPFLDAYGLDSARAKFMVQRLNDFAIEWIEDQYRGLTGVLSATIATGATAMTVTDASVFKIGDIVIAPDGAERFRVNSVDLTNNTLSVTGQWDGTSDASQATGTLTILTEAQIDNTAVVAGPVMGFTTGANNIIILRDSMTVTDLSNLVSRYGIDDYFQYELDKKMPELYRALERAMFRNLGATIGTATAAPRMKGLTGFVTTNTFATTQAALTLANIETNIVLPMRNAGSNADEIWCNWKFLQTIKNIHDTSGFLRVTQDENQVGMVPTEYLSTPWGRFRLRTSLWCATTDVFFVDSKKIGIYEFQPFYTYDLPGGNFQSKGIQGAYSLLLANETAHGRLNFTA